MEVRLAPPAELARRARRAPRCSGSSRPRTPSSTSTTSRRWPRRRAAPARSAWWTTRPRGRCSEGARPGRRLRAHERHQADLRPRRPHARLRGHPGRRARAAPARLAPRRRGASRARSRPGSPTARCRRWRCASSAAARTRWRSRALLSAREDVPAVRYPGLPGDPGHEVARRQMRGYGMIGLVRPRLARSARSASWPGPAGHRGHQLRQRAHHRRAARALGRRRRVRRASSASPRAARRRPTCWPTWSARSTPCERSCCWSPAARGYLGGELLRAAGPGVAATHLNSKPSPGDGRRLVASRRARRSGGGARLRRLRPAAVIHTAYRQDGPGAGTRTWTAPPRGRRRGALRGAARPPLHRRRVRRRLPGRRTTSPIQPNPLDAYGQSEARCRAARARRAPGRAGGPHVADGGPRRSPGATSARPGGGAGRVGHGLLRRRAALARAGGRSGAARCSSWPGATRAACCTSAGPDALSRYELALLVARARGVAARAPAPGKRRRLGPGTGR